MGTFVMPSLGADMESGKIVEWRVQPGDVVRRGDIVAVVDTDKSTLEVEVFESGVVSRILVGLDESVPVGTALALIEATVAAATATVPSRPSAPAAVPGAAPGAVPVVRTEPAPRRGRPAPPAHPPGHLLVSPVVRQLAHQLGVDPDRIPATGPGGRVTRADVERAGAVRHRGSRVPSSPLARRRAGERGVDLTAVTGSGPRGAVLARDVDAAATA